MGHFEEYTIEWLLAVTHINFTGMQILTHYVMLQCSLAGPFKLQETADYACYAHYAPMHLVVCDQKEYLVDSGVFKHSVLWVCTPHRLQCTTPHFTKHKFPVHATLNV